MKRGIYREYTIAVEALGRKASTFDSHVDPIVRVTARTLRKKLQEIYRGDGKSRSLQVVMPLGHYVPQFVRRSDADANSDGAVQFGSVGQAYNAPEEDTPEIADAGERTFFRRAALFLAAYRRGILKAAFVVLALAGVFVAGFFLGQRTDRHSPAAGDSVQWGESVWSDDFNEPSQQMPDPSKWTYDVGNQSG